MLESMELVVDPDVKAVAEFMQKNIPAARLASVADGLAGIAPSLWGQFKQENIQTLQLQSEPMMHCDSQTLPASSE
jgi:hypothetical protein